MPITSIVHCLRTTVRAVARATLFGRRLAVFAALLLAAGGAGAQSTPFPSKPIRIVVGFAPGGGSDFIARLVAQKLSDKLGSPVVVENRPGAGGNIGADIALKSPADGYTLYLAAASYTVNPALYRLSFDPVKDMTPIAQLARGPFVVAVHPAVKATTLRELVALAKKEPGKLAYASAGNGSITHMASEYFTSTAGVDVLHIPYKGTSPALTDTIAGQTQIVFGTTASTLPFVKSGQLRALAVTTARRLATLPDVPTIAESGYPGFDVTVWHGLIGPKGIPADIVAKLNQSINEAMVAPGMDAHLASDGLAAAAVSPAEFGALIASEIERWGALARARGVKID